MRLETGGAHTGLDTEQQPLQRVSVAGVTGRQRWEPGGPCNLLPVMIKGLNRREKRKVTEEGLKLPEKSTPDATAS